MAPDYAFLKPRRCRNALHPGQARGVSVRSEFDCVCVPAGTDIFHRGDAATCAYLIEEGEVRIWVPDESGSRELALLGAAEIFGEMAIIDGGVRSASATATDRLPPVRDQAPKALPAA